MMASQQPAASFFFHGSCWAHLRHLDDPLRQAHVVVIWQWSMSPTGQSYGNGNGLVMVSDMGVMWQW